MSWARWGVGGSDVYVFEDVRGGITCCACSLQKKRRRAWLPPDFNCETAIEMLAHLEKHRKKGHCVTDDTMNQARDMIKQYVREDSEGEAMIQRELDSY